MSKWVVHCRKSKYDVFIGRPGPYGNPFIIGRDGSREEVIAKHKEMVENNPELVKKIRRELRGKILGCFCAPNSCHGDTYAEIANEDEEASLRRWRSLGI